MPCSPLDCTQPALSRNPALFSNKNTIMPRILQNYKLYMDVSCALYIKMLKGPSKPGASGLLSLSIFIILELCGVLVMVTELYKEEDSWVYNIG